MSTANLSPTRLYVYENGQYLTTSSAAAVRSTAINNERILLHAVGGGGFFRVGNGAVTATVGAGSIPLEQGEKFHLDIDTGQFVSWIRNGGTDCSLAIVGCN
jgi:hypothetical protein